MTIRQQATPNPSAMKFTADRRVVEGRESKSFYSAGQAAGDPVAAALFALDGVDNVFMADDFVTVTRAADADWTALGPRVIEALEEVLGA